jgi:ribosomal protein S12 methylthiotransferase
MINYYLEQLGCVKNQVDGETILQLLNNAGCTAQTDPAEADIIIVNSCGFIEPAKLESINTVLSFKRQFPNKKIILAGCLAARYANDLQESLPEADILFGNADLEKIVDIVVGAFDNDNGGGGKIDKRVGVKQNGNKAQSPMPSREGERPLLSLPGSAYIKIAEGCNNHCSFCAIPLIRGALHSRSIEDIYNEAKTLLARGIKELCLIAQDLAAYGADLAAACLLPDLLQRLSQLEGDFWVRLLYIHPDHFPVSILEVIKNDKRFLPYFDLPFQHASEPILKAMNRKGNAKQYLALVKQIRDELPDAIIRSTFMVGFPGESEEDFLALLDFQNKAQLDWLGVFAYSKEEDTKAFSMKARPAKRLAESRKKQLEENQIIITEERMDRLAGKTSVVLVEEEIDGEEGLYLGRLFCHAPEVDGAAVIETTKTIKAGEFFPCKIIRRAGFDLQVELV